MNAVSTKEDNFHKLTMEWAKADKECGRTYAAWKDACARRVRLAALKNNAWGEIQMERASKRKLRHRR